MKKEKDLSWLLETPIAHRGLHSRGIEENTLEAVEAAIKGGYNIEIDIMLTKDNEIIVFHDIDFKRLTGNDGIVSETTYEEIKEYKIKNTESKIPLLKEVLLMVQGKVGLLIEIKSIATDGVLENILMEVLEDYEGKYAIQSFNVSSVIYLMKKYPKAIIGQLSGKLNEENYLSLRDKFFLKNLIVNLIYSPDFIGYEFDELKGFHLLYKKIYRIPFLAWTVKDSNYEKGNFDNIIFEGFNP